MFSAYYKDDHDDDDDEREMVIEGINNNLVGTC